MLRLVKSIYPMKSLSPLYLFFLLATTVTVVSSVGCSRSPNKSENHNTPASAQTPADVAFAKAHGVTWITTSLPPTQPTLTVDFQDGLFTEGSTHACELWVMDVQRERGVLLLTGLCLSTFANFEIEITTNMLPSIRTAGGKFSFVRLAFQVETFNRIGKHGFG